MITTFLAGFALGFSLILAIGAQNAFVLRHGLMRLHVFQVCLICAVSDALLIAAGVAGIGVITRALPWFEPLMRYGGAAFLIWYGARSARSAWKGGHRMEAEGRAAPTLRATVLTALAFTWLNPHVYLDTMLLIGSISAQYADPWIFGSGAILSSFTFFFGLGYGARILAPLFARPRSWQVLDGIIALTMWAIAVKLLVG
ncbi:LysE/ArgO family amino acid transporter [Sulfitobacter sp. D35]|uniref:LysE/ArgO family amino acid transporter n=1 Tax=Sulfitobacter sp. D35 TaxID=3083252 RepID=UPI00296EBC78|nr:LysE/ArgO family amino acid transporter [Sulfitobacter sp. D35]MDW4499582.1 LysE/ArgO family amino acid transporter [Sulfitobacter sp. D35]